jgi:hypothetical protein
VLTKSVENRRALPEEGLEWPAGKSAGESAGGRTQMAVSVLVAIVYFVVTAALGVQMFLAGSLIAATAATAACGFCFIGAAHFVGSFRARHATNQTVEDLIAVGVLASILVASGIILTIASGLSLNVFGFPVGGAYWAGCGVAAAMVAAKEEHGIALNRLFAT